MARRFLPHRILLRAVLFAVAGLALAACNTMEGMGKDIKSAGSKMEEEAQDANQ